MLAVFLGEKVGILMLGHVLSAFLIFPGAVVVNFAGPHFLPARSWREDPRRARLAGWLSIPVTWGLCLLSLALNWEPSNLLRQRLGLIESWLIHAAGLIILGSTMSLLIGWAMPPKKASP